MKPFHYCVECYDPIFEGQSQHTHRLSDLYSCIDCATLIIYEHLDRHTDFCELVISLAEQGIEDLAEWMQA